MRVLVVNAGSSSLKLSVLDSGDAVLDECNIPVERDVWERSALEEALGRFPAVDAVGHRVVHGGREFVDPVRLDAFVVGRLRALGGLAPLHQPKSLAGIEALEQALPGVPAVACFDTAFHSRMPVEASTYAVPARWRGEFGVRRYGFHGLSHAYAWRRVREWTGAERVVVARPGSVGHHRSERQAHQSSSSAGKRRFRVWASGTSARQVEEATQKDPVCSPNHTTKPGWRD